MTMGEDQAAPAWRRVVLYSVAAVLALVLPFVLVTVVLNPGQGSGPTVPATSSTGASAPRAAFSSVAGTRTSSSTSATSSSPRGTSAFDAVVANCRLANLRQQADLAAAAVSLEQFQKHIDAMNLLVTGKITLAVAQTFWNQTRVGASDKAAAFRAADTLLAVTHSTCPEPALTAACTAPVDQVEAVTACAKAGMTRDAVLVRARAAITTWEHHIHDMELLRTGQISPAQATAKWNANWQAGQQEVDAYSATLLVSQAVQCPLS